MKYKSLFVLSIIMISFFGCSENHRCKDYDCFTPPQVFLFELIDSQTGENLFTNGTYNPSQLRVVNLEDSTTLQYSFIDENQLNVIQFDKVGWQTEIVDLSFQILGEEIFGLYIDAERLTESCCSFTRYHEIQIKDASYNLSDSTGIYQILVE